MNTWSSFRSAFLFRLEVCAAGSEVLPIRRLAPVEDWVEVEAYDWDGAEAGQSYESLGFCHALLSPRLWRGGVDLEQLLRGGDSEIRGRGVA